MTVIAPLVDFFVRYVETEGALAEAVPEGAVVMLTEELQSKHRLPEEVSLTEDPEIGREEGYYLLSPGHPLLREAAESVLSQGDVGHGHLRWPEGTPPTPAGLEHKAREQIHPDHGRVDVTGAPTATYVGVLRVGAMVAFSLSIDEQVQELEEVLVLADGTAVPKELELRLSSVATEPGAPEGCGSVGGSGVAAAHALLGLRVERRSAELARQAAHRLRAQLEVVDDYYLRLLGSIEERQARAADDRARLLAEQAGATRTEWERRRGEVADEIRPATDVRPFRLHVIWVPSWHVAAAVRRGSRAFPLPLTYVPLTSTFLSPRCPACGSQTILVAGKDRLTCRACTPPEPPTTVVVAPRTPAAVAGRTAEPLTPRPAKANPAVAPRAKDKSPSQASSARVAAQPTGRATPKGSSGRAQPRDDIRRADRTGDRLTRLLWETVLSGERLKQRDLVRWSPIEALFRLYGPRGAGLLVGMRDSEVPRKFVSETLPPTPDGVMRTVGHVETSARRELRFYLDWRSDTGRLLSLDAWPLERAGPLLVARDSYATAMRERLASFLVAPPFPLTPLQPAERHLLRHATEFAGLGYASRCLAASWWLSEHAEAASDPGLDLIEPDVLAAAIEASVARRAGMRLTVNAVAERYGADLEATRRQIRSVQKHFKATPAAGW